MRGAYRKDWDIMKYYILSKTEEAVYSLINGIPYGYAPYWFGGTAKPLCLDLILPKRREELQEALPVIVWICGGAFWQQDRSIWLPTLIPYLKHGYAVAAVDYRVTAQAPYPAAVCDVKQAIRFLKAHSGEFGIDKEHIAVMGESAGGYLAAMAGVNDPAYDTGDWLGESSAVQAVIDYYGVADLKVTGNDPACDRQIAEFAGSSDPAALEQASPVYRVGPDAPPFLIFHGDSDQLVPISESEALYEALIRQGVRADFYVVEGEEHGADAFYQPNIREIICGFLDEVFRK